MGLKSGCNLLMDTSVLLDFHYNGDRTKGLILDFAGGREINFIILDAIREEWLRIERSIDRYLDAGRLDSELKRHGTVRDVTVQYHSKAHLWAESTYCSRRYRRRRLTEDTLSRGDCLLLRYALDNDDWTLVTRDVLLGQTYGSIMDTMHRQGSILFPETGVNLKFERPGAPSAHPA